MTKALVKLEVPPLQPLKSQARLNRFVQQPKGRERTSVEYTDDDV